MAHSSSAAAYADALEGAVEMAKRDYRAVMSGLDPADPAACKRVLLAVVPAIVERYGGMAAAAAAEYYRAERARAVPGAFRAQLAGAPDAELIRSKVRWALRHLFGEGNDGEDGS